MLQGVVSILNDQYCEIIEGIWSDLEREFGLKTASNAYPHFSYQVVEHYHAARTKGVLRRFTRATAPFPIRTSGLGIFTGDAPTIYVSVARSIRLSAVHNTLWTRLSKTASGIHDHHYGPDNFIPHITLAAGDLLNQQIPDVIRLLSRRAYNWEIPIDNVALVLDAVAPRERWIRFPLGSGTA